MSELTMKQMLESGTHFGHQTKRWNPKMKKYIFGARNGIYIIDLQKSLKLFNEAADYLKGVASNGGKVLFVGTKKQAQEIIAEDAQKCGMFYVTHRWLGGMLTNFNTIKKSINRLKKLEELESTPDLFTKKELLSYKKEKDRLEKFLNGIKDMNSIPEALFIIDPRKERIAFNEAKKLNIKVIGMIDTNCDPSGIDFVIPANDDAIRSIKLIVSNIADAVLEGKERFLQKKAEIESQPAQDRPTVKVSRDMIEKEDGISDDEKKSSAAKRSKKKLAK